MAVVLKERRLRARNKHSAAAFVSGIPLLLRPASRRNYSAGAFVSVSSPASRNFGSLRLSQDRLQTL